MRAAHWLIVAVFAAVSAASFAYLSLDFASLFSANEMAQMWAYAKSFWPPDVTPGFLRRTAIGAGETVAISAIGTGLAAAFGLLLALPAAGRFGVALRPVFRLLLNFLRAVPELVWAALLVLAAGLGPFAGTLALGVHTSGVLGRLFAETLENTPTEPADALIESGSPAAIAFLYGTLPGVMSQCVAYTLYRWEYNIRMAAVLGFVGAGGLGQMLYFSLSLFQQRQAFTVILAMLALVAVVDAMSAWIRGHLVRDAV